MNRIINKTSRNLFLGLSALAIMGIVACNNGTDDTTKSAATDTVAANSTTPDTSAAKPAKKVRKGSATAAMVVNSDNKMKIEKDKDGVYINAEHMPEYPGGDAALSKYIEENINYPQDALDQGKEGTVRVSFIVDEKGMVTKPMAIGTTKKSSLDTEAERVVQQMPAWKPGMVKGKNVKTRLELPITFKLADS